jgi:hypothetical protein
MSLPSLKTRRDCHKLCFLHKIINYNVDSSDALLRIGFNVPLCNLRHPNLFHVYCRKHNYSYNSPLNSALRLINLYCNELDFCGVSINKSRVTVGDFCASETLCSDFLFLLMLHVCFACNCSLGVNKLLLLLLLGDKLST